MATNHDCHRCCREEPVTIAPADGLLIEHVTDLATGRRTKRTHRILQPYALTQHLIDTLTESVYLDPTPCVLLLDEDAGHLGTYWASNLVAVGLQDARDQTKRLLRDHRSELALGHEQHLLMGATQILGLADFVCYWVMAQVLAHELGHMMHAQDHPVPAGLQAQASAQVELAKKASVKEEISADYLAGTLWGTLGWDRRLGELISYSIGCTAGKTCTHGDPEWRRRSFGAGMTAVERARETAIWQAQQQAAFAQQQQLQRIAQVLLWSRLL